MLQHLDDNDHELPPSFRDDVLRRARQLRRHKLSVSGLIVFVVVLGFAAGALAWVSNDGTHQRVQVDQPPLATAAPNEPIDIVYIGSDGPFASDGPAGMAERAETVLFARLDPVAHTLRILSFPRDLQDPRTGLRLTDVLVGHDAPAITDSVHLMLELPIHHYIKVDFNGFRALVDEMGGVRITSSASITDAMTGLSLPAGCSTLDGNSALAFVRARHVTVNGVEEPNGDLGRTVRQQAFVEAVLANLAKASADPSALERYARSLVQHAELDSKLDLAQLVPLGRELQQVPIENVETFTFPFSVTNVDGATRLMSTEADAATARQFLFNGASGQVQPGAGSYTLAPC